MNYNEFFLRLLKEAAMPTYPSASETDGLAQQAVAGDDGDLDAVNDSFGMPEQSVSEINRNTENIIRKFNDQLDSAINMKGDVKGKATAFNELSQRIERIQRIKAPTSVIRTSDDVLANAMSEDTDLQIKVDEAKAEIKRFNDLRKKISELESQLDSSEDKNEFEEEIDGPSTLPTP